MNLQEQIMEQAKVINDVASKAYDAGYKKGYEDAKRENFLDNADKANDQETDHLAEGQKEQGELEGIPSKEK